MKKLTDVLIVGSGISGLYAALNLREDLKIIIITKSSVKKCNSYLAQGGISVARGENDLDLFIEDTLRCGKYKNDISSVEVLAKESIINIDNLIRLGCNFENDENGLIFTREGAHSVNRIVYHKDITGKHVEEVLLKIVKKRKNIEIIEYCELIDIHDRENICIGALCIKGNNVLNIYSKVVVLATGGIGGLFKNSTNERILTGDSIGIAIRKNIKLKDFSYIQFHPTALVSKRVDRRFLISESVRGEGGELINCNGKRFVNELLPRDILVKKIYEEINKTNSKNVFLNVSFMKKDFLKKRFPNIYNTCLNEGIDISKNLIPVSPAQHYFMGGIKVDLNGKTSMKNLYAFGETSCTGVHGANRLASNSLLEALVFSRRGALKINKCIDYLTILEENIKFAEKNIKFKDLDKLKFLNNKIVIDEILKMKGYVNNEFIDCRRKYTKGY